MRDPTRTVLVIADQPHSWAMLRDRLDPELAHVAWARPDEAAGVIAALDPGPWVVAGGPSQLPDSALGAMRGLLFALHWVGEPPPGLPLRPRRHDSWRELAGEIERLLAICVGGLRLAPKRGLLLPDGRYVGRTGDLEALIAAYPQGLEVTDGPSPSSAVRRAARVAARHRLSVRVVAEHGRVAVMQAARES